MRASLVRPRLGATAAYVVLLAAFLLEQAGRTTSDTKASLVDAPAELLRSTFSLWNPQVSLGELQNQAYGYLFPMGPFFAGLKSAGVPAWVTERLWSWILVVVACEGARLVSRQLDLRPWPAVMAGLAYGLNVRMVSEIGVRSAEVIPTAVIPWVLLPVIWTLRGRVDARLGALCSAAAFLFVGAVNGTATVAPLPLVVVFIVWGCRSGLARWSFLGWWSGFVALASIWWASSLLQLSAYSPPFFDYVEDARTTTSTAGFEASLRGASNWVGYLSTGREPSWPSAWSLNYEPVLVAATGVLAAVSIVGLATFRSRWRAPLVASALIGLVCLTIGHTSDIWLQSPLAGAVQHVLDHPFALLRNIAKIDPVLRLPMAVGFGVFLERVSAHAVALTRRGGHRRGGALRAVLVATCLLVVAGAQPVFALNVRTPGWSAVPSYWTQTARFLADQPGQNRAWIVPGSGFGIQTWGWTMDEPMSMVGRTPWVTRSQVPLVNAETIRMLSSLEDVLDTGAGSAHLGEMLQRVGLGYVVLRHDLDGDLADSVPPNVVSIALARSSGIRRVATFGSLGFGPAIEVFEVTGRDRSQRSELRVLPQSTARTISSGPADVLAAVGGGLLPADQGAVVSGDSGWTRPANVVGDGYQLRERQFGRVHSAEGPVLGAGEPDRELRRVQNYPGSTAARPVTATYRGVRYVDASTSQAYPDSFGPIQADTAPFAAVDGDPKTRWTTSYLTRPKGQWRTVRYQREQAFGAVTIQGDDEAGRSGVRRWEVTAGGRSVFARPDPLTGTATAQLGGVRGTTLTVKAAAVGNANRRAQISIREIEASGLPVERTLVVPPVRTADPLAFLFTSRPETRACVPTLVAPDCDPNRYRPAEEATGIDRDVTADRAGTFVLEGTVVARADPATVRLLDPFAAPVIMHASSTYLDDPTVSPRMAYDGTATTSWIADPRDPTPTLTVDFQKPQRIDRLTVAAPATPGVAPASASLIAGDQIRQVDLGGFGTFDPLVTKHLEIRFANPTRAGRPIGVGDVRLSPGHNVVPLDGTTRTGAVCGFGPNVYVDQRRYLTRVDGVMGDVSSSGPLALSLCDGPIALSPGRHHVRIASTNQFQPVRVVLAEPDALATARTADGSGARSLTVLRESATSQTVHIGPGEAALLVTGRNWNKGWTATLGGVTLHPQRIDGWAQGWRLPTGTGGTVRIEYQPQRAYLIGLVGGLAVAGTLLLLAVVLLLRTRLGPGVVPPSVLSVTLRRHRVRRGGLLGTVVVLVAGLGLGGLPGLLGGAVARAPGGRRHLRLAGAGALMVTGPLVTAVEFAVHGRGVVPDAADLLSGTGAVLALVLGLSGSRDENS
jgi:arabinofuranan 3-O-arabinosyltransferase